jgi:hypothetical protein
MVAALLSTDLFIGLGFGLVLGLLIGPVVRSWLIWREWVSTSREANLVSDVLDRMEVAPWPRLEPRTKVPDGDEPEGKAAVVVPHGTRRRDAP